MSSVPPAMRTWLAASLLLVSLAGCTSALGPPASVAPTLAAIEALGYECGTGVKDNVPSGLYQWSCRRPIGDAVAGIGVNGNDAGVAAIFLDVSGSTDPDVARREFVSIAGSVPPLTAEPTLIDPLAAWHGSQETWVTGGIRMSAVCDATQCIVEAASADSPTQPMPLP